MRATISRAWTRLGFSRRAGATALAAIAALASTGIGRVAIAGETAHERWYVMRMQGERAGWMVERQRETSKGNLVNESEMRLTIERLGSTISIAMRMGSMETAEGELLEMRLLQDMGLATVKSTYVFEGEGVRIVTEQMGRTTEKVQPLPAGRWLTPREAERFEAEQIAEGKTEFAYDTIDVSAGLQVVHVTRKIVGPTKVEAMGKTVPAIEWETTSSATPGITVREFVDARGEMVRTAIDLAGIQMEILESDKAFALSDFDAPELMASTMVHPTGKVIADPRSAREAVYLVSVDEGPLPVLPTGGAQRFEALEEGRGRVVVNVDAPLEATPEEIADARFREASTTVDSEDPAIIALAARATEGMADASAIERARAIEGFVHEYISSKNLGVGFATASEVCQTREGDCSEHAVLLAAMLRAQGIPSRGVSGLVYVDQFVDQLKVFGYHMWAQALIADDSGTARWIDLDAAVYPMDATHIAVTTSSLADDDVVNSMVGVADVLNSLAIEVEDVE